MSASTSNKDRGDQKRRTRKRKELFDFLRTRPSEVRKTLEFANENSCENLLDDSVTCDWKELVVGKARFQLCSQQLSWHEAAQEFRSEGLSIAKIDNAQQSETIGVAASAIDDRHSAIGYVTPAQRHCGQAEAILAKRRCVYERAKQRNPERWSGAARSWDPPTEAFLNPDKQTLERLRS